MSGLSLAPYIVKRPWLLKWVQPLANWYGNAAGYRQLGLRADDLIAEENPTVQLALKRLSPKETYDRVFRMRRAFQNEWTKPEEDKPYLSQLIEEIEIEEKEREDMDSMVIKKK